jgi:putative ABC transport system ATP-binding protein
MLKTDDLMVSTRALCRVYQVGDAKIEVLKDISLDIPKGKFVALCGPSGSGKTTLLNIIGGIDRPSSGEIIVANQDLTSQNEDFLADFRCNQIGFVFQAYNFISTLTVAENVAFPMEWLRKPPEEIQERVNMLLETVGLQHRETHFPSQLSGGEQQRVALARALANDPPLILADEPTGNLDQKNAQKIIQTFQLLKEKGKTIIVSTHDLDIRQLADKEVCLDEGRLTSQ